MRWLRLLMGLIVAYQAIELHNGLLGMLAGLFIFQALANVACCGTGACRVTPLGKNRNKTVDVEFKEIRS